MYSRVKRISLVLGLLISIPLSGKPIDASFAKKIAQVKAETISRLGYQTCEITSGSSRIIGIEQPLAYVFQLDPTGFVVVSADDRLVPVIAYSAISDWSDESILTEILAADLTTRLKALELLDRSRIEYYRRQWRDFGDLQLLDPGDSWPPAGRTWTGGWVETVWHQSAPYNDYCPIDPITDVRCYTGCPATALAQIINFWQYPDSVVFTAEDSYTSSYAGREIFIDAPEASMSEIDYNSGSPSTETAARLSYATGVATRSVYSSQGSGVFDNKVCADALLEHFDFADADHIDGNHPDFYDIMEQNMKDSMPGIIVIIWSFQPGGHTLVVDGLRDSEAEADPEWHLNFGYGATQPDPIGQAWYVLPTGLPMDFDIVKEGILNVEAPRRPVAGIGDEVESIFDESSLVDVSYAILSSHTTISYNLHESGFVRINVWDRNGTCVRNLVRDFRPVGRYTVEWDGKGDTGDLLPAGVYFVRIHCNRTNTTVKTVLVR